MHDDAAGTANCGQGWRAATILCEPATAASRPESQGFALQHRSGRRGWGVWHSALGHGIPPSSRPIYPAEEGSGAKDEDEGRSSRRAAHPSEPQSVVRLQGALATSFGREPTRDDEAGCKGPAMCTRRHGDSAAPGPREGSEPPRPAKRHRAVWHGVCVARAGGQACEHRRHRCLIRELRRPALQYAPMHTASRVCRALAGC